MFSWIIWSHPGPDAEKQPQTVTFPPPCFTVGRRFFTWYAVLAFLQTNRFILDREWKACGLSKCFLLATPPMNVMSIQFSSDCRRMYINPRCCQRGLQLFRGDLWSGFYLIYYSSGCSKKEKKILKLD